MTDFGGAFHMTETTLRPIKAEDVLSLADEDALNAMIRDLAQNKGLSKLNKTLNKQTTAPDSAERAQARAALNRLGFVDAG